MSVGGGRLALRVGKIAADLLHNRSNGGITISPENHQAVGVIVIEALLAVGVTLRLEDGRTLSVKRTDGTDNVVPLRRG